MHLKYFNAAALIIVLASTPHSGFSQAINVAMPAATPFSISQSVMAVSPSYSFSSGYQHTTSWTSYTGLSFICSGVCTTAIGAVDVAFPGADTQQKGTNCLIVGAVSIGVGLLMEKIGDQYERNHQGKIYHYSTHYHHYHHRHGC